MQRSSGSSSAGAAWRYSALSMLRPCALGRCALLSGENVFGLLQWALRGRGRVATAVISPDWQRRVCQTSNQQLSMRLAAEGFRIGTSPPVKTRSPVPV
ncbi:hypothetical protein QQF64_009368 [Cirrhinus molitorella]|uniref:Uncharacterized protein n=1 Tax=Cirrhinus molitorella TaxID=172907 RepID=A0ABR3M3H1_9TELE